MAIEKSKILKMGIPLAGSTFILALECFRYGLSWRILATLGVFVGSYFLASIILGRKANRL
ncbi:hypothetical protein QUC32_06715 [Novosphingobium resinovorum]|uniref:hypothetical protein n=1 Tax=Sphingomonadaceae TaxID=41297 RepID=UPI0012E9A83C|nr:MULTISPECIES: hypothetical protein [Sphingomonadaceae]MBF7014683.1 hypothetical protein [Novosphingobium sp. HR1a]WJM24835.1 hypothetical protein QUC32_06715 [Novosphingobium resinovorum]